MKKPAAARTLLLLAIFCAAVQPPTASAQRGDKRGERQDGPPPGLVIPPAPVLTPEEALGSFRLEEGFRVEIVAAEPLIHDPVAVRIDGDGRIWVVEMQSFMPDVDGKGEDAAVSRIVILEDADGDGRMDAAQVFLGELVLPRALQFVPGGVLYADQQRLYFVPVEAGDRPGEPVVIDPDYAKGGNVEHKANGLLRGLDNWLYSAKSSTRYRFAAAGWISGPTEGRGQWGISQDDQGRLYYNGNSSNVHGDWLPPSALLRNPTLPGDRRRHGVNVGVVRDARVYPVRPTPGVNRGYRQGMLDGRGRLRSLTAACGPLIYRGDQFPPEFRGNAFTPGPCANLVKRNILAAEGARVTGRQAYAGREFLASTDERFRPVALANAPDGTLYVVDFYRGILQHRTYVTSYLREQILDRGLDKPTGLGRIYRVVYEGPDATAEGVPRPSHRPRMSRETPAQWVAHLGHPNGWWRDTAQRLLVDNAAHEAVPDLVRLCGDDSLPLGQIHALWALEGLGALTPEALAAAVAPGGPEVRAQAVRAAESLAGSAAAEKVLAAIWPAAEGAPAAEVVDLQLALTLGRFAPPAQGRALERLADVLERRGKHDLFLNAALSGLAGKEAAFLEVVRSRPASPGTKAVLKALEPMAAAAAAPATTAAAADNLPPPKLTASERRLFEQGREAYATLCVACHKDDGAGLPALGPPLAGSEWVTGPERRLAALVVYGMAGPVTVKGKRYTAPEIQPLMPGLAQAPGFDDEKIAAILTYVRNSMGNRAEPVRAKTVAEVRRTFTGHDLFTEAELMKVK